MWVVHLWPYIDVWPKMFFLYISVINMTMKHINIFVKILSILGLCFSTYQMGKIHQAKHSGASHQLSSMHTLTHRPWHWQRMSRHSPTMGYPTVGYIYKLRLSRVYFRQTNHIYNLEFPVPEVYTWHFQYFSHTFLRLHSKEFQQSIHVTFATTWARNLSS